MNKRSHKHQIYHKGFTLIELLVVVAIIALLMAILMPALNRVRKQAKATSCQARLKQWALIWSLYASDNNGHFHVGLGGESQTGSNRWPDVLEDYYKDESIGICPMAVRTIGEGGQNPFAAWGGSGVFEDGSFGSFGFNEFLCDRPVTTAGGEFENYWKNIYNVKNMNNIPLFLDCVWYDVWVHDIDAPPAYDGSMDGVSGTNEIRRVCLNRHNRAVNSAFLDWSVRKVDLKELWTLQWHKNYDTNGPWTLAGNVQPSDWPEWMRSFKDY
ncbi:MAG: type II secretion system protein [Phycisphaerales bacterium]|jgi:prepilin-type N-terminal cleavage/methylation domain-containing protein/prepilin-type processing-associated H-X9-DG protein